MSGTLPNWLSDWLGVAPRTSADAATWQLNAVWPGVPWVTLLLVLALIAWTIVLYSREQSAARRGYRALLIGLRLAALGMLLVMIAQWAIALRISGPLTIALVIDRSASMGITDRYDDAPWLADVNQRLRDAQLGEPSRLNLAKLLTTEREGQFLRELNERFRLQVYTSAESLERVAGNGDSSQVAELVRALSASGQGSQATRLGDTLRKVLAGFRGTPAAAVILLSDGVTTEGLPLASAADEARRMGVPIIAVGLGSEQPPKDIELADVLVDDAVFVDDVVSVQLQIKASGLAGQTAEVTLHRVGESQPVSKQTVQLPAAGETRTTFLVDRPTKPGEIEYVAEIAVRDDEIDRENNRQRHKVSVRDEKIRVLLVQGYPSFEFRYLKSLLERDRSVQLSVVLQEADPEFAAQDKSALPGFPVSGDELMEYDVLLIGDMDPRLLPRSSWQNIRTLVAEKGAGVAFLAGPRYMPSQYGQISEVAALLPIEPERQAVASTRLAAQELREFFVRPTALGWQFPAMQLGSTPAETEAIWQSLAPLYWFAATGQKKPAAQVLATASASRGSAGSPDARQPAESPLILFQYVGPGRVLFHAIDSTWRWRRGAGDVYFVRYWVQTVRFLARGKLKSRGGASLTSDRREYRRGETVSLRARFFDSRLAPPGDEATVVVEPPGEARRRVALRRKSAVEGVFEGALEGLAIGQYEAVLADAPASDAPSMARFSIVAPPGELARPEMAAAALAAAASTTHGKFYTMADADRLLSELPPGRRVPLENTPPVSIWNRWWLLLAFLGCITSEWVLRKRKGML